MENAIKIFSFIILLILMVSCTKTEETLVLNEVYHYVSDIKEYCQGSCAKSLEWEEKSIYLQGHVLNIANDAIMQDYFDQDRFYINDIRNGLNLEIRIAGDKNRIVEKLGFFKKNDRIFIRGKAKAIPLLNGSECNKGVYIEIANADDIAINL